MLMQPRKMKFRKSFRGKMPGNSLRGSSLVFGKYGIKAITRSWLTARQIESARRAMTRLFKREGQIWIRIFPDRPVTAKPAEVGMGGGKGAPDHFVVTVTPGRIIFEMDGINPTLAKEAFRLASHKLPVKTKFIEK
ncbi:50S ribosomal protein L16 [Candidatus Berkelbacteria bacterium CG_4_8_14_3_um_filter_33_6]|uniref:Large ribosomal subunit protein uL16 n=1 Tax=Candidatus Berkelbacteria bacterium CG_4_10_14_0_2_um_filter_35_9_33_12 TaxID=1974499 RepID=A0A2M7W4L2_9BACT|nr:MAG: 50S ribosomal protein L16 [Candidatus Berkelbacteria bacterium CG23_combo_of_CG06-09_8_20_14_all_33_15]PIS08127.1 MAG: 50S ribosomal protein L16 [Candidatus Berkelbacteria bacterium CG10_big_fil_rev_8_21_14_0_10_33_10]PIX31281.1 MAG: 50S ribosomal protein L16 [Candidatus Berkelbacteria bacterium CG_4_8_14_3_um_filter_33_6]PIZ28435.1 MAG: 50S ribosomal protein L16 [Candidatus Berkelbacteria bacterium CG_4_10_14_0_8_um_filter_35_9_33_8]PJA20756.1 MAG: 50S ribosomal protein L16 [Candidatus